MSEYNAKNYTEQGGEKTVIGGTLEFTDDAKVVNMPGGGSCYELPVATGDVLGGVKIGMGLVYYADGTISPIIYKRTANQAESTASTIEELVSDFNELLSKLKAAELMEQD